MDPRAPRLNCGCCCIEDGTELNPLVAINLCNPTGSILDQDTIHALLKIFDGYSLVFLASEVYQAITDHPGNRSPTSSNTKLHPPVRRHDGYFELANVPQGIRALVYQLVSVGLCPPLSGGQIDVASLVRPPKEGSESYPSWRKETDAIHAALAKRSRVIMSRAPSSGALYLFPQLHLTSWAVKAAKDAGMTPHKFYFNALPAETGIWAVSGAGFGQREGKAQLRLTCSRDGVEDYMGGLERFHRGFMEKHED
ncbi:hypothetical protein FRC06_005510 [Ceratobasidium sp. 370]|nr:hypothetical protein FRC06_005510 [Ceratobasidium sp. 370]